MYYKLDPNQILQEHVDEEHRGVINGVQVFKLPGNGQPPKSHLDKNSTLVGTRRNGQLYKKDNQILIEEELLSRMNRIYY